jgi:hypothetical protein
VPYAAFTDLTVSRIPYALCFTLAQVSFSSSLPRLSTDNPASFTSQHNYVSEHLPVFASRCHRYRNDSGEIVYVVQQCCLLGCFAVWTANIVPSSPILVTLMMKAIRSSETFLTTATRLNIPEEDILQSPPRAPKVYLDRAYFSCRSIVI